MTTLRQLRLQQAGARAAAALERLREVHAAVFEGVEAGALLCSISRPFVGITRAPDGSVTNMGAVIAEGIPCRLINARTQAAALLIGQADRESAVEQWLVELPLGMDVQAEDDLLIGTRTFNVSGTDAGKAFASHVIAVCKETT